MSDPEPITEFQGRYRWLSNFHIEKDGLTVEHRFQAAKALDPIWRDWVMESETPGIAKKRGKTVLLRPDWDEVKDGIMRRLVLSKFNGDADLTRLLLATGSAELIEGNTWGDTYWGRCDGQGSNVLGRILMDVRHQLGGPCPHCPDGHADPTRRRWAVWVAPDRDGDRQPTTIHVSTTDGSHVSESDAEWIRGLMNPHHHDRIEP